VLSSGIKKDFPILNRLINNRRLVYLDNAATSQKPLAVINAVSDFYKNHNANVHRGIHTLSEEATNLFDSTREKVGKFIGSNHVEEVIFTSGTTHGLNIASRFLESKIKKGSIVVVSEVEHNSNFLPWINIAKRVGAVIKYIKVDKNGVLDIPFAESGEKIDLLCITHASNVTGEVVDIKNLVKTVKKKNKDCLVVIDGAQAVPHISVNVQSLGCDFYAFSAHKMCGPTGVGVLWVKRSILKTLNPVDLGGGVVINVNKREIEFAPIPERFEAGTQNVAGVVGFGAAIDYLKSIGMDNVGTTVRFLGNKAYDSLSKINGVNILGPVDKNKRSGVVSFTVKGIHAHDLSSVLDSCGVAVRSGNHCAMILHNELNIPATVRASFYFYNTEDDVKTLVSGIRKAKKIFRV